jgi:hypothetical protein
MQQRFLPELSRPDHRLPQQGDCRKTPVKNQKNKRKKKITIELQCFGSVLRFDSDLIRVMDPGGQK